MARLKKLLREPLVQFLMIGLALFAGYRALNPGLEPRGQSSRIELTDDDLLQMSVAWLAQGRPAPTAEQMRNLVELRVREEILYREALALGLDKEDTIVKRRLAQKMEFLAEGVAAAAEPTSEEIRTWFATNPQRFALPPRTTFRHLYFSFDRRGQGAREAALRALPQVADKPNDLPDAAALADRFMFQDYYADRSLDDVAKLFGPNFARAVMELTPGSWQGPIESGYGWHLVWVDTIESSRVPAFEEIEADVKTEWAAEQRADSKRKMFDAMRARYEVVLPGVSGRNAFGGEASAATR
jgi:peptidyl-prolyl cis-trans isomerase C